MSNASIAAEQVRITIITSERMEQASVGSVVMTERHAHEPAVRAAELLIAPQTGKNITEATRRSAETRMDIGSPGKTNLGTGFRR
jgi:hypothetical protein